MWYNEFNQKNQPQRSIAMISVSENSCFGDNTKQIINTFFNSHDVIHLLKECGAYKSKGLPVSATFRFIFSLLFTGKTLFRTLKQKSDHSIKKDTVYRFLQSERIDWIRFLSTLARTIIDRISPLTSESRRSVFIIDDSFYDRSRSKKAELLTKVYDHAKHVYGYGYRLLTLGWSDGNSFIPVNFCLMSSKDTKKQLAGEKQKQYQAAKTRRALAQQAAPDTALALLKQAKAAGIKATHVLFDSWFSFPAMILSVAELGYHTIAMVKKSKKIYYEFNGKRQSVKDIYKQCKKRRGRSRYLLSVSVFAANKDNCRIPARLVFVRNRSNRKDYLVLISTDMDLTEDEIIQTYGKRWAIEVYFKIAKSYLRIVKGCSSLSYDAITAHTAIVFSQFMMLAEYQRMYEDTKSIGDLFFAAIDELHDITFQEALLLIISVFIDTIQEMAALSKRDLEKLENIFMSTIPPALAKRLGFSV